MAALDVASMIGNVKTMLSNCATWQTVTGTASASDAATKIHEYGVDDNDEYPTTPLMILDLEELPLTWGGGHLFGDVEVLVRIELEIPVNYRATYAMQGVWFWEQLSGLLADINSGIQSSGELMFNGLAMPYRPGRMDDDTNRGRCEWMCQLSLNVRLQ